MSRLCDLFGCCEDEHHVSSKILRHVLPLSYLPNNQHFIQCTGLKKNVYNFFNHTILNWCSTTQCNILVNRNTTNSSTACVRITWRHIKGFDNDVRDHGRRSVGDGGGGTRPPTFQGGGTIPMLFFFLHFL